MSHTLSRPSQDRGALSVDEFCAWAGISRSRFYREVNDGRIVIRKIGRKSVVTTPDAQAWLAALPVANLREAA
ncbi:DNA-binding protein [Aureimonas phyllosphaerae]|uniref:DNA-binding protein n=1 Tax=Aureimonas phyllosphaerae TaxID=1166078 RepID=UPI003A5BBBC9